MKKTIQVFFVVFLIGLASGLATTLFLYGLQFVTSYREDHPAITWWLPVAGALCAWAYAKFGANSHRGNDLIIEEIHVAQNRIPFRMFPLILASTWVTHLFGGSAGREGTGVQMGGALAETISRWFKSLSEHRSTFLTCGLCAGFSSVFGTPVAGAIFGLEVLSVGKFRSNRFAFSLVAALVAHAVVLALGYRHPTFPSFPPFTVTLYSFVCIALLGLSAGWLARAFVWTMHEFSEYSSRLIPSPAYRAAAAGLLITSLVWIFHHEIFVGLGDAEIQAALTGNEHPWGWIWKAFYTVLTLGSGMKGGEVTPLFFVGSSWGSHLGTWLGYSSLQLASLGFLAVFAGASNTPIACTLLGIELFGREIAWPAAVVNILAYLVSGGVSLYRVQRDTQAKLDI